MSNKQKYKKDSYTEKKSKAWNRGKRTQMQVTVTVGLATTDKGYGCWILNATLSEKAPTTGVTQDNLELSLLPNSLNSDQTQNDKMKFWTDPTFLLPLRRTHVALKALDIGRFSW